MSSSSEIAALLDLTPHPEGGFYSETFRDSSILLSKSQLPPHYKVERSVSSAINFLLPSGSVAKLHRIPCAEGFHFYKGEPLTVFEVYIDGRIKLTDLGSDLGSGQRPQYTVPPNVWFGFFPKFDVESYDFDGSSLVKAPNRDPEKHYSLVGITCAPAFQFEDSEPGQLGELSSLAPNAQPFIEYLLPSEQSFKLKELTMEVELT